MYLYKAIIYKAPDEVVGLSPGEISQHQDDKLDFETNFKASAVNVNDIVFAKTTFVIDKTYVQFKVLVDGTVRVWSDANYIEDDTRYILYLIKNV